MREFYNEDCLYRLRQLPDKSVDLLLQDIPYGTTKLKWDKVPDLKIMWAEWERVIKDNGAMIFTSSQPFTTDLINSNRKRFRYEIVWKKTQITGFLDANRKPLKCHENIIVFYKKQPTYNPQKTIAKTNSHSNRKVQTQRDATHYNTFNTPPSLGTKDKKRFPVSVIEFSNWNGTLFGDKTKSVIHPTQKPVELFRWLIRTYTNQGDVVFDGYAGSGTTAIAAILEDRNFICCEWHKDYYLKAAERIAQYQRAEAV